MPSKRTNIYCGPESEISVDNLAALERSGNFIAEYKKDGAWCSIHIQERFNVLESRTGIKFPKSEVGNLDTLNLNLPPDTILIGELEAASESATKTFLRLGYRRIWLFDIFQIPGYNLRAIPLKDRLELLRKVIYPNIKSNQILISEYTDSNFESFYHKGIEAGEEGIVVKNIHKPGYGTKSTGKTNDWFKCKPWRSIDYVILPDPEWTDGRQLAARLALFKDGKFVPVMRCPIPGLSLEGGKIVQAGQVVEMYGREMQESGALRHAQFLRFRTDKSPQDCEGITRIYKL